LRKANAIGSIRSSRAARLPYSADLAKNHLFSTAFYKKLTLLTIAILSKSATIAKIRINHKKGSSSVVPFNQSKPSVCPSVPERFQPQRFLKPSYQAKKLNLV
jgi:hypothetical protein